MFPLTFGEFETQAPGWLGEVLKCSPREPWLSRGWSERKGATLPLLTVMSLSTQISVQGSWFSSLETSRGELWLHVHSLKHLEIHVKKLKVESETEHVCRRSETSCSKEWPFPAGPCWSNKVFTRGAGGAGALGLTGSQPS